MEIKQENPELQECEVKVESLVSDSRTHAHSTPSTHTHTHKHTNLHSNMPQGDVSVYRHA